ncbi:MAG: hypothetical protein ACREB0_13125, partial [Sphingopyxis sp.]
VFGDSWPIVPGAASRASGRIELLHFAPRRWLAPNPPPELIARIDSHARQGRATVVEVEGNWREFRIRGLGAARLLACGADVEGILARRDCAALALFDCPVIVAREPMGFEIWVQSSYASSLREVLDRLRERAPSEAALASEGRRK